MFSYVLACIVVHGQPLTKSDGTLGYGVVETVAVLRIRYSMRHFSKPE